MRSALTLTNASTEAYGIRTQTGESALGVDVTAAKAERFGVHGGAEPIRGREALRQYCVELFARYEFGFEEGRTFFGDDYWVFEWTMILDLIDTNGSPFNARVEMLEGSMEQVT